MISATLMGLAFALYLISAVCQGASLFLRIPTAPTQGEAGTGTFSLSRFGRPLLLLGIVVQFAAIGAWCITTKRSPFASEFGTLSVMAWLIALAFALVDLRLRLPAVGAVALLVASTVLFWGVVHARGRIAETELLSNGMVNLHVMAILASFGLFAVAFGCAALYLMQNSLLKTHKTHSLFRRIPPLATLDKVAYHCVAYGLPLLTVGLTLGILRAVGGGFSVPTRTWLLDAHTIASIITWVLYVCYVVARLLCGWRGVRLQYILLAGLLVALALYFVPTSAHHFA